MRKTKLVPGIATKIISKRGRSGGEKGSVTGDFRGVG